jgi:hypothetical protein
MTVDGTDFQLVNPTMKGKKFENWSKEDKKI